MKIETKIDFWKKKLLDIGKRNRLINFPLSKSGQRASRSSIMIEMPSVDELWDSLSNLDSYISFPVVTKADKNIDVSEGQLEFDKEPNEESPLFPNGYKTNQMPYEAYLDFLDDETVLNYIDIARKNEEFWKLEKRIINKIIAFYIIKKEQCVCQVESA